MFLGIHLDMIIAALRGHAQFFLGLCDSMISSCLNQPANDTDTKIIFSDRLPTRQPEAVPRLVPRKTPEALKRFDSRNLSKSGFCQLSVSKNSGTTKSSILIGFSMINHPF